MMTDRGLSTGQASSLLVVFGLASLAGRMAGAFIIDRVHGSIVGPIVMLAPIAGMFFLHSSFSSAAVAGAFIGIAYGIEGDLLALLGTAFGPLLLGLGCGQLGSYAPVIPVLVGVLVIGAILIGTPGRYTYPAVNGFDRLAARDELAASSHPHVPASDRQVLAGADPVGQPGEST